MSTTQVFLRTHEAAEVLRLSPRTLERMRLTGRGPVYRYHGRIAVYRPEDLSQWSEATARRSTSEPAQPAA